MKSYVKERLWIYIKNKRQKFEKYLCINNEKKKFFIYKKKKKKKKKLLRNLQTNL